MRLNDKQRMTAFVLFTLLLVVTAWAIYDEFDESWKGHQKRFKHLQVEAASTEYEGLVEQASAAPEDEALQKRLDVARIKLANIKKRGLTIKQNWLRDFDEADRCMTCHQGADVPGFESAELPLRTHSGDYLKFHPVDKFGCVTCHDGQAETLTVDGAHGEVEHWLKPLNRGSMAQSACGECHFVDQSLPLDASLNGAEMYLKGWKIYMENNCLGCHKLKGYERSERIGPVLTPVGKKVKRQWITGWIKKPKDYLPKTLMPEFKLSDEEAGLISAYLFGLSEGKEIREPKAGKKLGKSSAIASGKRTVKKLGCLGCHAIGEDKDATFGPELSDIASKTTPDWLYYWLKDPKAYQKDTPMPDLRIPERQIGDIVAYLSTLRKDDTGMDVPVLASGADALEKGRKLVKDKGCTGCHEIEKFPLGFNAPKHDGIGSKRPEELAWGNAEVAEKNLLNFVRLKVREPRKFAMEKMPMKMPEFGFDKEQAEALATFLMGFTKDEIPEKYVMEVLEHDSLEMKGRKFLDDNNCLGCHKINKKGGETGPDLSGEGAKVRPDWLFGFLKKPRRIRPMQEARMPDYRFRDHEVETVIQYFSFLAEEEFPFEFEPRQEAYIEDLERGEKLYLKELACLGCHSFEARGGMVGPDHTDMASRLKRQWVEKWIKDPQKVQRDVRMPRFVFEENDMEYLTNHLMTMGRERFLDIQ